MATDIAFVVGCLSLLGRRVPYGVVVMMLSLAIVDDLAAVVVIALFYTASIKMMWLAAAAVGLVVVAAMNASVFAGWGSTSWLVRACGSALEVRCPSDHCWRRPRLDDARQTLARRS